MLTTPYSATFIVGDGETKTFSYLFEEVSPNFISVMVYNSLTGLISTPTYIIDTDQKQVIFGEDTPAPTADETVCIYRNTPNVQDVAFRTLHGYDAQTLENILSKIVAMIQEIKSNYFSTQVLQGDPWQLDLLSSADDGATVNIDYTAKKLVKGLYFRITSGNLQVSADGTNYITMPKSDDVAEFRQYEQTLPDLTVIHKLQYRVGNQWFDAEANAQGKADSAYSLAESVQTTVNAHINNTQNPHQTSINNLTDTEITNLSTGQFLMFSGGKWKNVYSSATASWGTILGDITDQTDLKTALDGKVGKAGDTMTGALNIADIASSNTPLLTLTHSNTATYKWNIAPRYNSTTLSVYPGSTETNGFRFATTGFVPASDNARYLGSASLKWKGVYTGVINNGYDIAVPVTNSADTFALESEITDINGKIPAQASTSNQLADKNFVNSSIATNTANFIGTFNSVADLEAYSGTVTNNDYAFVIGTDSAGNTTYNRYKYNGTTQQWVYEYTLNNSSFTAEQWASINSGVTSSDVALARSALQPGDLPTIGDGTITINQGGTPKGTFTVNQSGNTTIDLDAGGGSVAGQSIDAEIVGTLTVADNGDVSGFSNSNYLLFPGDLDMTGANSFEIVAAFTIPLGIPYVYLLEEKPVSTLSDKHLTFQAATYIRFDVNDGSNYQTLEGTTSLLRDTKYYAKLTYDGTNYTLSLSTDGINYTTEATAAAQYIPGKITYEYIMGRTPGGAQLHLGDYYIKKNGILVWQGLGDPGLHQRVSKAEVVGLLMPDYANGVSIATTNVSYTAPSAGWFSAQIGPASSGATISVNGVRVIKDGLPNVSGGCGHLLPVSQGDVITWTPGIYEANFFPCKGA